MMTTFSRWVGIEGLEHITFADLKSNDRLIHTLQDKMHELDPRKLQDQILEANVRLLLDLVRDTLADRYQDLTILAFAHIVSALDYFVRVMDETPDSLPGGYLDDLQRVQRVCADFSGEIDAYKTWKLRQPRPM